MQERTVLIDQPIPCRQSPGSGELLRPSNALHTLASIFRAALSGRGVPVVPGLSGLIVAGGYGRSADVARSAGVSSAGGVPRVGVDSGGAVM